MIDFRTDYYRGIKGIYFRRILRTIIRIGNLDQREAGILDFGCGVGKLKTILGKKVISYDSIKELSEVSDWRTQKFDVLVANEVLYLFSPAEIREFVMEVYKANPNAEVIVGISTHGILNKIAAFLSGMADAHDGTKTPPQEQVRILTERMQILKKRKVFFMCDVYLLSFMLSPLTQA